MSTERLHLWSWERSFQEWAGPRFERIFVALHPFAQAPGLKLNSGGYLDLKRVPQTHPAFAMARNGETGPDGIASNHDSVMKKFGKPRTWGWVVQAAGLRDTAHLARAIDSVLNRAKDEFMDKQAAHKLARLLAAHDMMLPVEDYLSPLIEPAIGRLYRQLGVETVEIGNQMDDAAAPVGIDDFLNAELALIEMDVPARAAYTHDDAMQLLTISDWNAHYTLVCLSRDAVAKLDPSKELEGFWATPKTSADWPYAEILARRKPPASTPQPGQGKPGQHKSAGQRRGDCGGQRSHPDRSGQRSKTGRPRRER
jgi:hypothetical protein